jgi:hypothetical protein
LRRRFSPRSRRASPLPAIRRTRPGRYASSSRIRPGGPRDIQARLLGNRLTEIWGRAVIIDNRAGASGIVGTDIAAKAAPDGYTLLMIGGGHAVNATLQPKLPYDSIRDFAPIARTSAAPGLVVRRVVAAREIDRRAGRLHAGTAGEALLCVRGYRDLPATWRWSFSRL